jgi:carbonic anhydrase
LAKGQHPEFLFIGCSDSRVPPSEMMGFSPGHVFVHRNIANIVPNTDLNVQSVIQYAVDVLEVDHVVVCGHYGCGGIAAALEVEDLGLLNKWLREIRDVYRLHSDELDAIEDKTARNRRLVELNVREQCVNVAKTSWVQKHYATHRRPHVHGWVYDLSTGHINDLNIPFLDILRDIQDIYRLDDE